MRNINTNHDKTTAKQGKKSDGHSSLDEDTPWQVPRTVPRILALWGDAGIWEVSPPLPSFTFHPLSHPQPATAQRQNDAPSDVWSGQQKSNTTSQRLRHSPHFPRYTGITSPHIVTRGWGQYSKVFWEQDTTFTQLLLQYIVKTVLLLTVIVIEC